MTASSHNGFFIQARGGKVSLWTAACWPLLGLVLFASAAPAQVAPSAPATKQTQPGQPGPRLFNVESEAKFEERMQKDAREQGSADKAGYGPGLVVLVQPYDRNLRSLTWPAKSFLVEPSYVCYGRLLFEQRNAERYGWDFGPIHPLFAGGLFFADVALLPYNLARNPCQWCECSAGLCLPGDPVPLLCYLPNPSVTGLVAEAATIAALLAIFP
jgi:hypothetical protein